MTRSWPSWNSRWKWDCRYQKVFNGCTRRSRCS